MKTFALITAAAISVTLAQWCGASFTVTSFSFGDGGGIPWRTFGGTPFYVHSAADAGDGTPSLLRPLHDASWAGAVGNDREWTSYITHDGLGPSRRARTAAAPTHNQSDAFYIAEGIFAPAFTSRNANAVSFTPGHDAAARTAVVSQGVLSGGSFTGAPVTSSRSPIAFFDFPIEGLLVARLTVKAEERFFGGGSFSGNFGTTADVFLNSGVGVPAPTPDNPDRLLYLNSYRVAVVSITDSGFDLDGSGGDPAFGLADVYDVWLEEATFPAPGGVTILAAAGLAGLRRRRTACDA